MRRGRWGASGWGGVGAMLLAAHAGGQGVPPQAARGAVRGVVYDSLAHGRLAGALVQIARVGDPGVGRVVPADSAGAFRIDSLAPGRYLLAPLHPVLDLLQIEIAPREVEVADGEVQVELAVPELARVRPAVCGSQQAAADSSALLAGRVRDADTEAPVASATVTLAWTELAVTGGRLRSGRRRVPVATGVGGAYVLCGVPSGGGIQASAAAPGRASGRVDVELPPRGFVVRDFLVGDSIASAASPGAAARGRARLVGTVRDPEGHPVRGARAFVWDAAGAATSNEDGGFTLEALPAGTRTLEVRAIGFAPRRVAVDLPGGARAGARAATADVRLATLVPALDVVTVVGKPSRRGRMISEFLERRQHSVVGRFLTVEDLERIRPLWLSDAFRTVPQLRVVPSAEYGNRLMIRSLRGGNCEPTVYIDGVPMLAGEELDRMISPSEVAGIEVYTNPDNAPPQYAGRPGRDCGFVFLWLRGRERVR